MLTAMARVKRLRTDGDRIARREFDLFRYHAARVVHHRDQIAAPDVDVNPAGQARVFAFQHRRAVLDIHFGDLRQRDEGAALGESTSA